MKKTRFYSKGPNSTLMDTQCIPQKMYSAGAFVFQMEVPEGGDLELFLWAAEQRGCADSAPWAPWGAWRGDLPGYPSSGWCGQSSLWRSWLKAAVTQGEMAAPLQTWLKSLGGNVDCPLPCGLVGLHMDHCCCCCCLLVMLEIFHSASDVARAALESSQTRVLTKEI